MRWRVVMGIRHASLRLVGAGRTACLAVRKTKLRSQGQEFSLALCQLASIVLRWQKVDQTAQLLLYAPLQGWHLESLLEGRRQTGNLLVWCPQGRKNAALGDVLHGNALLYQGRHVRQRRQAILMCHPQGAQGATVEQLSGRRQIDHGEVELTGQQRQYLRASVWVADPADLPGIPSRLVQ